MNDAVRDWDRDPETWKQRSEAERAARFLYLMKTCFNGLYRTNRRGQMNVAFGRQKNTLDWIQEIELRALHDYLANNEVELHCKDYSEILADIQDEDTFVYLGPPYVSEEDVPPTVQYLSTVFADKEHVRPKACCDELTRKGIKFLLSNSTADIIYDLYAKDYIVEHVNAYWKYAGDVKKRGKKQELLIRNYEL